jgi:hypothetical protein
MRRITTAPVPQSHSLQAARQFSNRVAGRGLGLLAVSLLTAAAALAAPAERPRETILRLVAQIQRADYEGNRAALQHLYADLEPFNSDEKLASRVRYWRGFALWRRAINGFNESADPKDLEHDLTQAIAEFKESTAKDPAFVDAKVGTIPASAISSISLWGKPTACRNSSLGPARLLRNSKSPLPIILVSFGFSVLFSGTFPRSVAAARTKRSNRT